MYILIYNIDQVVGQAYVCDQLYGDGKSNWCSFILSTGKPNIFNIFEIFNTRGNNVKVGKSYLLVRLCRYHRSTAPIFTSVRNRINAGLN